MAEQTLTGFFTEIADAIREVDGSQEPISALNFPDRIKRFTYVPSPQEVFEAMSWHDIKQLSSDKINAFVESGVYKTEQVGTDSIQFQLVSGEQYDLASGSGKNKMVLLAKNLLTSTQKMANTAASTTWKTCLVKQNLEKTIYPQLSADLQNEIEEIKLPCFSTPYEGGTNNNPSIEYVNSKLFIPSASEILPQSQLDNSANYPITDPSTWEGNQFKWYENHTENSDRIKKRSTSAQPWWMRSPYHRSAYGFVSISNAGVFGAGFAVTSSARVAVTFCL